MALPQAKLDIERGQVDSSSSSKTDNFLNENDNRSSINDRVVEKDDADSAFLWLAEHDHLVGPNPEKNSKRNKTFRRKVVFCVVTQTWVIGWLLMYDKFTLGQSAILGFMEDLNMSKSDYNNLFTFFYVGYIISIYPMSLLLQKVKVKAFISGVIYLASLILFLHAVAKDWGGMVALRFFMGVAESYIISTIVVIHQQYFSPHDSRQYQCLFWTSCGFAPIAGGLVSYGCYNMTNTYGLEKWRWLHIIVGAINFVAATGFLVFLPDNPSKAFWLTTEEKVWLLREMSERAVPVENKKWKKYQAIEAVKDVKSWLFAIFVFFQEIMNNKNNQEALITQSFGFSVGDTALLGLTGGGVTMIALFLGYLILKYTKNSYAYVGAGFFVPCAIGCIGLLSLPWSNKWGLYAFLMINNTTGVGYIVGVSWSGMNTAGYTKKLTAQGLIAIMYCVSNMIAPQLWQPSDAPRYRVAWSVGLALAYIGAGLVLLGIRFYLVRENRKREILRSEQKGKLNYVEEILEDGTRQKVKVDAAALDLTDRENLFYEYTL